MNLPLLRRAACAASLLALSFGASTAMATMTLTKPTSTVSTTSKVDVDHMFGNDSPNPVKPTNGVITNSPSGGGKTKAVTITDNATTVANVSKAASGSFDVDTAWSIVGKTNAISEASADFNANMDFTMQFTTGTTVTFTYDVTGLNYKNSDLWDFAYTTGKQTRKTIIGSKIDPSGEGTVTMHFDAGKYNFDIHMVDLNIIAINPATSGKAHGDFSWAFREDAVPEPASWALMLGGFGMVGGVLRASKRKALVAFN